MNYAILGLIVFILLAVAIMFNMLVVKRNQVDNISATVDILLKKRYDLIPNLVETVKGYAAHESALFANITELRSRAMSSGKAAEKAELDGRLAGTLKTLFAVSEKYPELKASEGFLALQRSLNEIEEQISAARRAFSASVNDYNNAIQTVPLNILAGIMGMQAKAYFSAGEEERKNINTGELFRK
ncbi:MAG: LemA family protein [Candidatus Firestonebacteria bacterium]